MRSHMHVHVHVYVHSYTCIYIVYIYTLLCMEHELNFGRIVSVGDGEVMLDFRCFLCSIFWVVMQL